MHCSIHFIKGSGSQYVLAYVNFLLTSLTFRCLFIYLFMLCFFRVYLIRLFDWIFISKGMHLRNVEQIKVMLPKILEIVNFTCVQKNYDTFYI